MASRCDIEISIDLHDDIIVAAMCGCDIDILIEVDKPIEIEAFDWPPVVDLLKTDIKSVENRVKELEDNPPTIEVDDELTEEGTNPVSGRGIWAALSTLWQGVQDAISAITIPSKLSELENDRGFMTNTDYKVNNLGTISGLVEINLNLGNLIIATIDGSITPSFVGLPDEGNVRPFILKFMNIGEINWDPDITSFTGGIQPTIIAPPCKIYCEIDHTGNLEVNGLIDGINTPI